MRVELRTFIRQNLNSDIEFLSAIVFGGDALSGLFKEVRGIVADLLPEQVDKIHDTVDPTYAGVVGAGEWAKYQALNPKDIEDLVIVDMPWDSYVRNEL